MSMILRFARSQGLQKGLSLLKPREVIRNTVCWSGTTSPKKSSEVVATGPVDITSLYVTKKTWESYGFDEDDETLDRHAMHVTLFWGVSVLLMFGAFVLAYLPDPNLSDWAQREAFLQLRYREANNLPPIDRDLIDPSLFTLPSEEELQANRVEIII